jgi:hypothetical protein
MESDTKNAEKISEASLLVCDFLSELGYGKVSRKFREIIKQSTTPTLEVGAYKSPG